MSQAIPWRMSAIELAKTIRAGLMSAREATQSVLDRIAQVNPKINALPLVLTEQALAAADAADETLKSGGSVGPLHGVPITIKINVDMAGGATTDGLVAFKDNIAKTDSPLVVSLKRAGAIIVGRNNAPAMSLRWFTDNDAHGRTLNPFDAKRTPGGSSGGAAAATATGMGAIHQGNDYGGSIRHPAWACGVVGLRTSTGRIPSYKASAPNRIISNQIMSVQGPLTRTVADARLALQIMAQGSPLDPGWVPAPLEFPDSNGPLRVAVFKSHPAYDVDKSVSNAIQQAADWLANAGVQVEQAEPPRFEEAAHLWRVMVMDDMRRAGRAAAEKFADKGTISALRGYLEGLPDTTRDQTLEAQMERFNIAREWALFYERYPVLLLPNSWKVQFPIDADIAPAAQVHALLRAQAPLLSTAMLGLPGLTVPTGVVDGLPTGVQLSTWRFREDLALRAGEIVERAANYQVLDRVPKTW